MNEKKKIDNEWLQVTIEKTALDSLRKAAYFTGLLSEDQMNWKWIVLSLYDSLYAFAIAALSGGDYDRVTYKTKEGATKLINFDEAIKRCCNPKRMHMYINSSTMVLSEEDTHAKRKLKNLRNDFIHFIPKTWFIEKEGLTDMSRKVVEQIKFLSLNSGNIFLLDEVQRKEINKLIIEILDNLDYQRK
ncbi:hypothetical protein K9N50_04495 [bacterium]|nr:hypothetical protein [bacterium]